MDGTFNLRGADAPFYLPQADECDIFAAAYAKNLPLLLKGPRAAARPALSRIWRQGWNGRFTRSPAMTTCRRPT